MIFKFFLTFILFIVSIPLSSLAQTQSNIESKIKNVTNQILKDEKYYRSFDTQIEQSITKINKNKIVLEKMNKQKKLLENDLTILQKKQKKIESHIVSNLVKKYSKSIAIKHTNQKSLKSIINNKVYKVLENSIKKELVKYHENEDLISEKLFSNKVFLTNLNTIQKKQEELILKNEKMKIEQAKNIEKLRKKYIDHVNKLKKSIIMESL